VPGPEGSGICFLVGPNGRAGREVHLDAYVRMELQYDGTGLHGWAKQDGLPTVEGCLESAFATVLGSRSAPTLRVAGRTDAGVHARQQVVSLRLPRSTDLSKLVVSLNALTPAGIAVTRTVRAREGFDARKGAVSREYRYFLSTARVVSPFWSRYCWLVGHELDRRLLDAAADATRGQYDFTAFTPGETRHTYFRRTVKRCVWRRVPGEPGMLHLEIEADSFLRHMVRTLVGNMVEVAEGKRELEGYQRLLLGADREAAGITAPAHGLFLWDIKYGADVALGVGPGTPGSDADEGEA
jgi:tRNA pseudouridine38-40 synthase